MRCLSRPVSVFSAAAVFVALAVAICAADQSPSLVTRESLDKAVAKDSAKAEAKKPAVDMKTPARHEPLAEPAGKDSSTKAVPAKDAASTPAPIDKQPKAKPADDALRPTPEAQDDAPVTIEAASFKGVIPGTSTKEGVEKAWGRPKNSTEAGGDLVQLYSVEPFKRVEVHYAGGKVSSIVIRFDRTFPAEAVAKQLGLSAIRGVSIRNDLGETLGLAYPERGVMFAFDAGDDPAKPSMKVSQIILEPLSAEPFVLRAENTIESRSDLSRRDLEQALVLEPGNARAHWLHSRTLAATEQHAKAAAAAAEAARLEPDNAQYRVTYAQSLAQSGRLSEAIEEAKKAAATAENRPHVKARATCLIGDLLASGPKPDFRKALEYHTKAIEIAGPLKADPHPAIRIAAKEVLVDAHLGAAHDIAWGDWKEKSKAVVRWLDRAGTAAEDLVVNEGGNPEQIFHVHARVLATCVGALGEIDPAPVAKAIVEAGDKLIAETRDPSHKAQLQWELGMALYDAVQICQMRAEYDKALKHGDAAAVYMADAIQAKPSTASSYLLGRLYFRLGWIHAMRDRDHKAATEWFDKAVPLMEKAPSEELAGDCSRHGDAFVRMGYSYWENGQQQKAVALTQKGIKWMEQAVQQGTLDRSALAVPYGNLAAMHRKLGASDKADRYQELASRAKAEKLR